MSKQNELSWRVAVFELAELVPRRVQNRPILLIRVAPQPPGLARADLPIRALKRGVLARRRDLELRNVFSDESSAKLARNTLAEALSRSGYTVNPNPNSPRHLYVLELDAQHSPDASKTWLHVGETGKPVEERIAQHLAGVKSSKDVRRYYKRRRQDLEPQRAFFSVSDSRAEETKLGKELMSKGFFVSGPQGLNGFDSTTTGLQVKLAGELWPLEVD